MKRYHIPEPRSPRSTVHKIWGSAFISKTERHWSFRPRRGKKPSGPIQKINLIPA